MGSSLGSSLRAYLEPVANWFAQFGTPEPIVHWGHPLMMGIVILAMGSTAAIAGWKIRTTENITDENAESTAVTRKLHKKVALWMTTFIGLGYTGGLLSLVMQGKPILESPHFWTGSVILALLGLNGAISFSKFGGGQDSLKTAHAYIGSTAVALMLVHAALGIKLGLSI